MTMTQSLLDFIMNLLRDGDAKAAFVANPDRALADAGLSDVCSEDVSDAMSYVSEYTPQVSYIGPREYNVGNSAIAQHNGPDEHHGDWQGGEWHGDPHATAVEKLEYISNNYSYTDSHDTVIDKSINQTIWNKGELTQSFDDHSVTATDHSVAAGRNIDGNVANGDGNVVGDGNSVGNTSYRDDHSINDSFNGNNIADHGGVAGDGNKVADHGGVAGDGNSGNVTNPDHSAVATNSGVLDASTHASQDYVVKDSFNDSHDKTVVKDSDNHYDNSGNTTHIDDSGNTWDHSGNVQETQVHETNIHETDIHDNSQHVDQHGLINANVHDVNALDGLLGH